MANQITQVVFKMDKNLKELAMKKAKHDGVAFSTILKLAVKAYVENDLDIRIEKIENFNAKTQRELKKAIKEIESGKGLSPAFQSASEAFRWMKKHGDDKNAWT